MFKKTVVDDASYVYNIKVKVYTKMVTRPTVRYATNQTNWYQVRISDIAGNYNNKIYDLYDMREFRKDDYLGLYLGELVDYNANTKEEHLCNIMKADRYKACMGMHYIKNQLCYWYATKYEDNEKIMCVMEALRKECTKKVNVKFMKDYLVITTKRIVSGD